MRELRLASMADRHLLVQSLTLTSEDYSGRVSIDATPIGPLTLRTHRGMTVGMALRTRIVGPGTAPPVYPNRLSIS